MTQADLFPARKMHSARLKNSERLQRALKVLREAGGWISTWDWSRKAELCAINSIASELRSPPNNISVECRCVGRGRYEYRLGGA